MSCAFACRGRRTAAGLLRRNGPRPQIREKSFKAWEELGTIPVEQIERLDGRPYRIRQHGGKALPLPPMLDTEYQAAKTRYKQSKTVLEEHEKSPLAIELENNSFAQALVTPIRQCNMTRVRLPQHFLQAFQFSPVVNGAANIAAARHKIICSPSDVFIRRSEGGLGRSWATLSREIARRLDKKRNWRRLIVQHVVDRAAEDLNTSTQDREFKHVYWAGNTPDTIGAMLQDKVRELVDQIMSEEEPTLVNTATDLLEGSRLLVTCGAKTVDVKLLDKGSMHYFWTGQPSDEVIQQEIATCGSQTYSFTFGQRAIELSRSLDRLLAYTDSHTM